MNDVYTATKHLTTDWIVQYDEKTIRKEEDNTGIKETLKTGAKLISLKTKKRSRTYQYL